MSFTRAADGIRIHYQELGVPRGEPVLMIQGLGTNMHGWALNRPVLGMKYRTIALDNRGSGRTDKPFARYTLEQMAEDAIAVLDATKVESAHVVGASMGGAIAQLVAVRHPERVRSLTLTCTACRHHQWRRELLAEWAALANERGMREVAKRAMRWLVGGRSFRRFAPFLGSLGPIALRMPPYAFASQIRAILDTDDSIRTELTKLTMPTLVVVGNQDILTPRGDSEELAELIPDSDLVVISGAAHGLMVEHATTYNRVLMDFLGSVPAERSAAA
jgi:3-oxoadipate enol-lactonase